MAYKKRKPTRFKKRVYKKTRRATRKTYSKRKRSGASCHKLAKRVRTVERKISGTISTLRMKHRGYVALNGGIGQALYTQLIFNDQDAFSGSSDGLMKFVPIWNPTADPPGLVDKDLSAIVSETLYQFLAPYFHVKILNPSGHTQEVKAYWYVPKTNQATAPMDEMIKGWADQGLTRISPELDPQVFPSDSLFLKQRYKLVGTDSWILTPGAQRSTTFTGKPFVYSPATAGSLDIFRESVGCAMCVIRQVGIMGHNVGQTTSVGLVDSRLSVELEAFNTLQYDNGGNSSAQVRTYMPTAFLTSAAVCIQPLLAEFPLQVPGPP